LAKIWNVGVDAFNGVSKDARGMSTKLYINWLNGCIEFRKVRAMSRYMDVLGNIVKQTPGLSLSKNHWPKGTADAVGNSCHGVVSFVIYFTSCLVLGSTLWMGLLNADDNEQTSSALRARCQVLIWNHLLEH
jgi:hypothetical protein